MCLLEDMTMVETPGNKKTNDWERFYVPNPKLSILPEKYVFLDRRFFKACSEKFQGLGP